MSSEKLAYCKFIKDSEFETRKVFERENIKNIRTRLETNRQDENQMPRSVDSSKLSKKHKPGVNLDPEPSSSDSSESSASDSRARERSAQRRKIAVSIGKMTRQTHLRVMILMNQMTTYCQNHRHQTQVQGKRSARRRESVVSIRKMTRPTYLQAMILVRPMTVSIDVNDAKIRNIGKRVQSEYAQLQREIF